MALTRALVRTPSVNPSLDPGGHGEAEVAALAAGWLESWGFRTARDEVEPGRVNVLGRLGAGGGPTLLLNGHLDTVGVEGMTVSPFEGRLVAGRLEGRGACDMKAGIGAILAAAAALAREGLEGGTLLVALTADEEHASVGMQRLVEEGIGGEGVRADAAVVCEPTELAVTPAHKGFLWLEADFRGRAAHGSRPDRGVDAIRHAALYLAELEALHAALGEGTAHGLLGHGSFHAGTIRGGTAPSVYPDACRVTLERRTLPGETPEQAAAPFEAALDRLRARHPEVQATLERGLFRPGSDVPRESPLVRGLLDALGDEGVDPRVEGMTAWVDAAFLNGAGIPAVCLGPGSIAQAHAADEWVDVEQIRTCARVLERFARAFLEGEAGSAP